MLALKIDTNCSLSRPSSNIILTIAIFFYFMHYHSIARLFFFFASYKIITVQPYLIILFVIIENYD
ncbi:hypothetical protein BDC45DRAFT_518469 [Circinella umbellata]|nr:hypothetical protein BDC45DRAFT_518469 [Circinella umbellata]